MTPSPVLEDVTAEIIDFVVLSAMNGESGNSGFQIRASVERLIGASPRTLETSAIYPSGERLHQHGWIREVVRVGREGSAVAFASTRSGRKRLVMMARQCERCATRIRRNVNDADNDPS